MEWSFGSAVTLYNMRLDPVCLWDLQCVARKTVFQQVEESISNVLFLLWVQLLAFLPSYPSLFPSDFISMTGACFSPLPREGS